MKLKKDLVLRKVAGEYIVVPIGKLAQISPVMQITSSTAWLWEIMKEQEFTIDSLVKSVMEHFSGVTEEIATKDVENFIKLLEKNYMLEDGRPEPLIGRTKIELDEEQMKRLKE